jgi:hypothetical protein
MFEFSVDAHDRPLAVALDLRRLHAEGVHSFASQIATNFHAKVIKWFQVLHITTRVRIPDDRRHRHLP